MNISELQAFAAVARHASFSQAAEALHLTQSAVSKRISALEEELDARLFDRIGRTVSLTEAGRELLTHARRILAEVEDSRRALANLAGHIKGPLHIGTSHHIGLHRLPPVLRRYTVRYPDVRLGLRFDDSEVVCRAVEHGELEMGVVTLPPRVSETLTLIPVWPDPLALVTAPDHPLCREPADRLPAALADYPAILPSHGTFTRQRLEQVLQPYSPRLQIGLETNYLETIKMMVSVGLGWSILPAAMIDASLRGHALPGVVLERTLGIVRHPRRTLSRAAAAFIDTCLEEAEPEQHPPRV